MWIEKNFVFLYKHQYGAVEQNYSDNFGIKNVIKIKKNTYLYKYISILPEIYNQKHKSYVKSFLSSTLQLLSRKQSNNDT